MAGGVKISDITADYILSKQPAVDRQTVKASVYQSVMEAWEYKNPILVTSTIANSNTENSYDSLMHSMIGFSLFFSMYTIVFGVGADIPATCSGFSRKLNSVFF